MTLFDIDAFMWNRKSTDIFNALNGRYKRETAPEKAAMRLTAHIKTRFLKISIDFRIFEGWKFGFKGSRFYRIAIGFITIAC